MLILSLGYQLIVCHIKLCNNLIAKSYFNLQFALCILCCHHYRLSCNHRFTIYYLCVMKYLLTLLICFAGLYTQAQNLQLHELKSFINHPSASLRDSLVVNGWEIRPELSARQAHQMYQTFSFGNQKEEQGKAIAWLRIHADNGVINQLYYQLPGTAEYELILKDIKASGTEKKDVSAIADKNTNTYYVSADYTFQTIVGAGNYTVMVMTNKNL